MSEDKIYVKYLGYNLRSVDHGDIEKDITLAIPGYYSVGLRFMGGYGVGVSGTRKIFFAVLAHAQVIVGNINYSKLSLIRNSKGYHLHSNETKVETTKGKRKKPLPSPRSE